MRCCLYSLDMQIAEDIGAGSRGETAPPGNILAPLATFAPPPLEPCAGRPVWDMKTLQNPAKTFFLKNGCFRAKKMLQIRRRPFFCFFLETDVFGTKTLSNSSEDLCFAFPILALSVLLPPVQK